MARPKTRAFLMPLLAAFKKQEDRMIMQRIETTKNKGGRPVKSFIKSRVISLKCTPVERVIIIEKAKKATMTVSEYLLNIAQNGTIVINEKQLPKEVLLAFGNLNHMAANLNQMAKKRSSVTDELNDIERLQLQILSMELKQVVHLIKNFLQ